MQKYRQPGPTSLQTVPGPVGSHSAMPLRVPDRIRSLAKRLPASDRGSSGDGQAMVEFALIFPILMVLVMAVIEFSLAFNAVLDINHASESAVLVASETGNTPGADCLILQSVDANVSVPNATSSILQVQIQRTGPAGGSVYAADIYSRTGSTTCTLADSTTVTVPYTATSTGYPEAQRCNIMEGCPSFTPVRSTVDTIGVQVKYTYTWRTPLGSLLTMIGGPGPGGGGYTFSKRNVSRLEPVL